MAKQLTKTKHCLSYIQEHNQYRPSSQTHKHSSLLAASSSRTKKKRYTNVPPQPPITSASTISANHTNTNPTTITSTHNQNHHSVTKNMCLAPSKPKPQSPTSSLNTSLHSLSSSPSSVTSSLTNDLEEEMSSSTSTSSSSTSIRPLSSSVGLVTNNHNNNNERANKTSSLSIAMHNSATTSSDNDGSTATTTRRGILVTSRSSKRKKRVRFAPPSSDSGSSSDTEALQVTATEATSTKVTLLDDDDDPKDLHASFDPRQNNHKMDTTTSTSDLPSLYTVQTTVIDYIQPSSTMTESQLNDTYWQLKDYEYFRGTAQIIANEVLKVTAAQPPTSHSYNAVMTRVYDLCAILSERDQMEQQDENHKRNKRSEKDTKNCCSLEEDTTIVKKNGHVEEDDATESTSMSTMDSSSIPALTSTSSSSTSSNSPSKLSPPSPPPEMIVPPHLFAALTHWVKAGHSRRGLEKFCVTSHVRTRPMAKAATGQAVLLAQDLLYQLKEEQRNTYHRHHNHHEMNKTNTQTHAPTKFQIGTIEFPLENVPQEEVLRLVSERFSKTSRYFGTAIGHADAAAVGNYEHPLKN